MIEQEEDEFQVGDVVYCAAYGEGVVEFIKEPHTVFAYPLLVRFNGEEKVWYTSDGRLTEHGPRCLFFSPPTPGSTVRPFLSKNIGKTVFFDFDETSWLKGVVLQEDSESLYIKVGHDKYNIVKSTTEYYFVEKEKE